jgi:hypothetical protein
MDFERVKLNAEIYGTRAKAKLRLVLQIAGIALVILGAYNLLIAPAMQTELWAPYRMFGSVYSSKEEVGFYIGDFVAMAAGAAVVWWS